MKSSCNAANPQFTVINFHYITVIGIIIVIINVLPLFIIIISSSSSILAYIHTHRYIE